MKVLALHGYMQSGSKMESALNKLLRGKLKPTKLITPTGPYRIGDDQFGWWPLPSREALRTPHIYENIEVCLVQLKTIVEQEGPFDCLIGFSQGAVVATILAYLCPRAFRHVILMSGSGIMDSRWLPQSLIPIPTLSLTGIKDDLCLPADTLQLERHYSSVQKYTHRCGHVIPNDADTRKAIEEFLPVPPTPMEL